ncbi:MAG: DNA-3-methyladenine glycosylase, partial [Acidobacteriota bacterium]|nr:DNA-3-methyladenine glycosylase [Acidobacteriota bacterium]
MLVDSAKGPLLERPFFIRPCAEVARDLLGMHLVRGAVVLRITEVEAYLGPEDSASHARAGRTLRTAPMWEAGGLAYVYLCYGLHWMLNIVAEEEGRAAAIL